MPQGQLEIDFAPQFSPDQRQAIEHVYGPMLVVAGAADVVSSVFRMMIVQQVTPDAIQGRVNSLIFVGLQGGPRLGDAEAGAAAAIGGTPGWLERNPDQLRLQVYAIAATLAWSGIVTFILLKAHRTK